jgi:uncharacterized protein
MSTALTIIKRRHSISRFIELCFGVFLLGFLMIGCKATPFVELKGQRFDVEISDNDQTRARGMMFRDALAKNNGMLFIFDDMQMRSFWMHNCKISLDILYFDDTFKLVGSALSVPPCNLSPEQCPSYPSNAPARYVLEIAAGRATELGVQLGDTLTFKP